MSETKHHWKQLMNTDYIGAYSLQPGEERTVEIVDVAQKEIKGAGGKKDLKPVATLKGEKPFIINATNAKTLTRLFGSPYIEDWKGKSFTLIAETIKDKQSGEEMDALRIKPTKPPLPELTPASPKWAEAVKAAKAGQIDKVLARYTVSSDNIKKLNA